MNPHRMCGIGDPPMGERVGGQQIAEFVIPARLWHSQNRDQRDAHDDYSGSHYKYREWAPPRQLRKAAS